jgi:hypothetical protein
MRKQYGHLDAAGHASRMKQDHSDSSDFVCRCSTGCEPSRFVLDAFRHIEMKIGLERSTVMASPLTNYAVLGLLTEHQSVLSADRTLLWNFANSSTLNSPRVRELFYIS